MDACISKHVQNLFEAIDANLFVHGFLSPKRLFESILSNGLFTRVTVSTAMKILIANRLPHLPPKSQFDLCEKLYGMCEAVQDTIEVEVSRMLFPQVT